MEYRKGDLFDCHECVEADIIVMETNIALARSKELCGLLSQCKVGMRLLMYNCLDHYFHEINQVNESFERLPGNGLVS